MFVPQPTQTAFPSEAPTYQVDTYTNIQLGTDIISPNKIAIAIIH